MSDIKFSGLHKLISWSHEILKLSSRKDPGKEYIPQVNSVNEGRLWGHFHLHQISTKMIIEYKTSYKMSEEKKNPLSLNHHLKEVIILRNPQLSIAFLPQSNNMTE